MEQPEGDLKRPRVEETEANPLHHTEPSRVLHVRGVADGTESADLATAVAQFGPVSYIVMMPKQRQALVEFQELSAAQECVAYATTKPIMLRGRQAYFNFSKSQEIKRTVVQASASGTEPANKILLFTVLNPLYPISPDVIHTVCAPHGAPARIVMVRKNGVQALVEFEDVAAAQRALVNLNGADVYANCCTLKIEFAKCDRLNVRVNSEETRDYTGALPPMAPSMAPAVAPPMPHADPQAASAPGYPGAAQPYPVGYGAPAAPYPGYPGYPQYGVRGYGGQYGYPGADQYGMGYPGYPAAAADGRPAVVMLYGVVPRLTCHHIFNLVCPYGNVDKVKFLAKPPGSVMVQMADSLGAHAVVENLNGLDLFGSRLTASASRASHIADGRPPPLPDGSPSQMDFADSMLNRFRAGAVRHQPARPARVLHFYNAAPGSTVEKICQVLGECGASQPELVKLFQKDAAKTDSGLIQFPTPTLAAEALALANHASMCLESGGVYTFKMCFSSQTIVSS
eukprot:m.41216 g.41216  ORF g.41216 m.41216 type:complete len:512 (-) comp5658_c0_seq1:103-1638(-)